jgi:class 3 adenylate cyclase/tetratricopeptide (TPR) repeat protein
MIFYLKFFSALLLWLYFLPTASAQKKTETDSLKHALENHKPRDSTRVIILNKLCWEYRNNDFLEAISYGKQAAILAERIKYYKGLCEALNFLGVVYRNMGDYPEASNRFYDALRIAENHQITVQIAYSNNNIGDILKAQKQFKEALPYAKEAKNLFEKLNDQRGLGFAYTRLGEIYQGLELFEKSAEAFEKSLQIRQNSNDQSGLITSYTRMGIVSKLQKDYKRALLFHEKALEISKEINEQRAVAGSLDYLASVYIELKEYEKAKDCALKSLEIALKLRAKADERNAYNTLAKIAEKTGKLAEAFDYTKKYLALHDSIDNVEKSTQFAKMQAIYDTKKKEQENALLKKNDEIQERKQFETNLMLLGAIIALGITLIGIYISLRSRQKHIRLTAQIQIQKQELETRKQKVENNIRILLQLSKNEAIADGDWAAMATEVSRAIVQSTQVASSQLWYYNFKEDTFYCVGFCGGDFQLLENIKVPFFTEILRKEGAIVIENVAKHAGIDEVSKVFFAQKNIASAIIYPNLLSDKQKGILMACLPHPKVWDVEDVAFMKSMEDEIVIAYQGFRRRQAQEKIEKQNKEIAEKNESLRTTLRLVKQEQKRTDELLLNILPFEVAEELKSEGHATPQHYKLVTVLFTDFKGFTQIAEKLTPQQVIAELDTCFLAFDEICGKYNLEKIKTIGDAYMCAGGIPTANETNPTDAVRAALDMQKWMETWAKEKREKGENAWEIRLGIHSGEVVAGIVGKKKFAYDIWGDAVNIASRMESSGEVGKVNISGATYQLVKNHFHCVFRGKIEAKNKGEIEMYFVEGERM